MRHFFPTKLLLQHDSDFPNSVCLCKWASRAHNKLQQKCIHYTSVKKKGGKRFRNESDDQQMAARGKQEDEMSKRIN